MAVNSPELRWEPHALQATRWPEQGRHILAQYDGQTLIVYQAYRASIAEAAVADGHLGGGGFSFTRMSWIKPNFLWMMHRAGWASKEGQERVLAIRLLRTGFDTLLREAVHSTYVQEVYGDRESWKRRVIGSGVRLQWDPDHAPCGSKENRRAVQLGIRGDTLRAFATSWTVAIEDVTARVHAEAQRRATTQLHTPSEAVYPVNDAAVRDRLGISEWPPGQPDDAAATEA